MDDHGDDQVNDQAEAETEVCAAVTVAQCASGNARLETKDPVRDRVREPVM
jgi:hypothetical protein